MPKLLTLFGSTYSKIGSSLEWTAALFTESLPMGFPFQFCVFADFPTNMWQASSSTCIIIEFHTAITFLYCWYKQEKENDPDKKYSFLAFIPKNAWEFKNFSSYAITCDCFGSWKPVITKILFCYNLLCFPFQICCY